MLSPAQVRRRRILGGVSAVLGIALVVLAILGFGGHLGGSVKKHTPAAAISSTQSAPGTSAPGSGQSSQPSADSSGAEPSSASSGGDTSVKLDVTVLNDGGPAGLATRIAAALKDKDWTVGNVQNYQGSSVSETTIFYPGSDPNGEQAAKNLQADFPQIKGIKKNPGDVGPSDGLVVVATGDFDPK